MPIIACGLTVDSKTEELGLGTVSKAHANGPRELFKVLSLV